MARQEDIFDQGGVRMIDIDVQQRLGNFQIDAQLQAGTRGIVALFGRSGSGKTSLVNMIAG